MKKRIIYMALCLLAVSIPVGAQKLYTLDECRTLALENSAKIKNSRFEVEAANQTSKEAFTNYFPNVSAMGAIFKSSDDMMQMDIEMPVPGLSSLPMEMINQGKMAAVTLVQPVFMGGRIVNGNKLAKIGKQVSEYQLALTENQVEASVDQYYWQLVALKEKLRTLETLETQLDGIHKDVEASVNAGLATRNDLLRVELQQQNIAAGRLKVENGVSVTKMLLCHLVGVEREEFEIAFDQFPAVVSPLDYYVNPEEGLENRSESKLLDKSVEAAKLQLRMTRGENLPSLGVGAGYIYHDLTEKDTDFGVIFATVSVPITSWWGGSHAIKREKIKKQQAENTREESREMMLVEIEAKWNELQEAYQQVLLSEKSIESSTENLRLNNDYYKAGTVSLSDLLDAQSLMQQSHDQYAEACTAYQQKLTAYLQATGR